MEADAFEFIDKWIESALKKKLHQKRGYYLEKAISEFQERNPGQNTADIRKKLENEIIRIYPMVDRSILKERIKRSRYTFWSTLIVGLIAGAVVIALSHGTALLLMAPIFACFAAWGASLATIPISYNQRVKGACDSVIALYEKEALGKSLKITKEPEISSGFQVPKMQQIQNALPQTMPSDNRQVCVAEAAPKKWQELITLEVNKAMDRRYALEAKDNNWQNRICGTSGGLILQSRNDGTLQIRPYGYITKPIEIMV